MFQDKLARHEVVSGEDLAKNLHLLVVQSLVVNTNVLNVFDTCEWIVNVWQNLLSHRQSLHTSQRRLTRCS